MLRGINLNNFKNLRTKIKKTQSQTTFQFVKIQPNLAIYLSVLIFESKDAFYSFFLKCQFLELLV